MLFKLVCVFAVIRITILLHIHIHMLRYKVLILSLRDQKLAHKFHKAHMGNRYLEVFEARYSEMSWMLSKNIDKDPKDAAEFEEFVSTNYLLMTLIIT